MTLPRLGLREAKVAAVAVRAILEQEAPNTNCTSLLVHLFSNAGSTMLYHLYKAYADTTATSNGSCRLPLHVTVFDSTPAAFTFQTLLQGILDGAPSAAARLVIMPMAYLYVALVWIIVAVLRLPDHIGDLAPRAHNDPAQVHEAARVYIYGPADRITPAAGVEKHAVDAQKLGFRVQREVFDGSGDVAHARKDADRY
ncbi:hypothetical protein QBC38DRAFT_470205 [Podospora fimiseda]|uniref:Uncharacterized protein n=1 Tax=Podospora fimiseda TaxID=252190 RepID=A0AAN7BV24_9PEZI|nr:hypothetical protein QBC38DRAFT_470205 [Podospora fimiseda]